MYFYLDSFSNNQVSGEKLLNMRPYILEELGVNVIGHQEIILEAVEHLRNFVSVDVLSVLVNLESFSFRFSAALQLA